MQGIKRVLLLLSMLASLSAAQAGEYDWVVGQWQLVYDPDGGETDYLEFFANGDVISRGPMGEVHGFYIASYGMVKAVLTVAEKDLILTFFHDAAGTELRIVTSESGGESIYQKSDSLGRLPCPSCPPPI